MIIFFGSFPILLLGITVIALISAGVKTLVDILPVLFCLFLLKDIVMDLGFGWLKNRKPILLCILMLVLDVLRTLVFFAMLHTEAAEYTMSIGLGVFLEIFDILIILIFSGIIFLIGEFFSLTHGFGVKALGSNQLGFLACDIVFLLILVVIYCLTYLPH